MGTLHMYLIEDKMDLRGVQVFKKGNIYFISPPSLRGENGEKYGCIAFTDQKKQSEFMKELVRSGTHYMKKLNYKKEPS